MVIDTSAIIASIAGEPDGALYRDAIKRIAPLTLWLRCIGSHCSSKATISAAPT
jgi:hypothetical protein